MSELKKNSFGANLRRRREELGLSLDDVATGTRVRKTYLHALEEENLQALPGQAYAIGFLRIYARQLGMPIEPLLLALSGDEGANDSDQVEHGADPRNPTKRVRRKSALGRLGLVFFLLILAASVSLYFFRPWTRVARLSPAVVAPAETILRTPPVVVLPTPPPPPSPPPTTLAQPGAVPAEMAVIPVGGAVVRMLPSAAGSMKVTLDNQEARVYPLQPEQSLNWKVTSSLMVELSAPGLVRIWIDQQELPVADYPAFTLKNVLQQEGRQ